MAEEHGDGGGWLQNPIVLLAVLLVALAAISIWRTGHLPSVGNGQLFLQAPSGPIIPSSN